MQMTDATCDKPNNAESVKLSVVVVSYNEGEYLSQSIDSILDQDHSYSYEIIIGDDGSNDGSDKIIAQYERDHPGTIRSFIVDRGNPRDVIPSIRASNVIKRAFSMARGEYLCVLSGDDMLGEKDRFDKQVAFLDANEKFAGCYVDRCRFWDDGKKQPDLETVTVCRSSLWGSSYAHISCFVFRGAVIEHLLDRMSDDTGLTFSIISTGPIKHIPGIGFMYRQRPGSIMQKVDELEASILSLMVYQDVLNHGGYALSSLSRYVSHLQYVFAHRNELNGPRYQKYLASCAMFPHDIVGDLSTATPLGTAKLTLVICTSHVLHFSFKVVRYVDKLVHKTFFPE